MRGCVSKRKNGTYAYTVEMGKHLKTGKRPQKMKAGFATRKEAEADLAQALSVLGHGSLRTIVRLGFKIKNIHLLSPISSPCSCPL
ncbi:MULTISPECIES: Arm DNA-binding domain-containing protein [Paenibacillus]